VNVTLSLELPATFRTRQLIDAGLLEIGDGYRAKNSEMGSRGLPFARAGNINGGFKFSDADFLAEENISKVGSKISQSGDVVFTSKGTVGRFAFVDDEVQRFVYSPQLCYWRSLAREVIDPRFLFFWIHGAEFSRQMIGMKGQTDMADYVSLTDQRQMFITLPPLETQKKIASILGALDDKIELNRRMNATLETIAQTLFKSWFVDFDPVKAKAAGLEPEGLDAGTAALFPSGFQTSSLGEIPEGWEVGTIKDCFDLTMGQSPPGDTYNENGDGLPFFQGKTDFGFRFPSRRIYCTAPTRLANPGDTLMSVRAPVGTVNMALEKCVLGRGVAAIRHKSGSRSFTYYAMDSKEETFDQFNGEGTVFGSINKISFENITFVGPPQTLVLEFEKIICGFDNQILRNQLEIESLSMTRDSLLPKLLSGELNVSEFELPTEATP
jgi:type I restriction enzyme, S subunit